LTRDIKSLIAQMTLEEKASLCSGLGFWDTKPIERLGIPSIVMTDGPHGLRKQVPGSQNFFDSVPATCFPTAATIACSWDRSLVREIGIALGEECQAEGVSVILGPGVNIKRSPLCGRNFEYFSEDPFLSTELAASYIEGVQSQGVGTSIKHFAANNQEHRRMSVNAIVDERTLREIYLASFEGAVKKSKPWTVMCAYNRLNGDYCSENHYLLTKVLREDWGYEGLVVSDWGAVNERVKGLEAGLDLEMPGNGGVGDRKIIEAVRSGELSEEVLDRAVERILKLIFQAVDNRKENFRYDADAHHQLARKAARESMVLLKNDNSILPLRKEGTIAVIGAFAKHPRFQGGGSSHVNPTRIDIPYDEIQKVVGDSVRLLYSDGYQLGSDEVNQPLIEEARKIASQANVALIFAGLPENYESEGYDRVHMSMPRSHLELIQAVSESQPNTVVLLCNGAPVEMPWLHNVPAVLECYLGGQAVGSAIADLLFGEASPCGKLAETFPQKLSDNPSYLNFPGEDDKVEYREGIFVGYRYYDTKEIQPLFPFGHGLSYTTFEYSDLSVDKKSIKDNEIVNVQVTVKNTGKFAGKEIVQLYVRDLASSVRRPEKELKGFEKVDLQPGEEKTVNFTLDKRAFAYYNVDLSDWYVETGEFEICVGRSSRDIVLTEIIHVDSTQAIPKRYHRNSLIGDLQEDPKAAALFNQMMQQGLANTPFASSGEFNSEMIMALLRYMPLRALVNFSRGSFSEEDLDKLLDQLNSAG